MSSKTQLSNHIKRLNNQVSTLTQQNAKLIKQLNWSEVQVGRLTLKIKEMKKQTWFTKLINRIRNGK